MERGRPPGVEVSTVRPDLRILRPHPPRAVPRPRCLPHPPEAGQGPPCDHHQVPPDHVMCEESFNMFQRSNQTGKIGPIFPQM